MKIASWNVNSIRARITNVTKWLEKVNPDVVLLQEIKCQNNDFPSFEFESLGYKSYIMGQKSYNGVAILSKYKATNIITSIPNNNEDDQARYIQATIKNIDIASVYIPNGNPVNTEKFDYKLNWLDAFYNHIKNQLKSEKPFIIGGDFNVIPDEIDAYDIIDWENNALYHEKTLKRYRKIINLGMTEAFRSLHPDKQEFTFWDYQAGSWQRNLGLRIDHFLLSPEIGIQSCEIDKEPRDEKKASDHTPIIIEV